MAMPVLSPPPLAIPPLVRRNTLLLALAQTLSGMAGTIAFALGPLMVVALVDSAALVGLSVSLLNLSRVLVSYPVGKLADAAGRRPGLYLALGLATLGAVGVGAAMLVRSFAAFVAGLLVFGMGLGASHQLRVAAADMYPPSRRGEGLGYVLTGSLIGVVGGPLLVTATQAASDALGLEPLALPWLVLPLTILPGIVCVWLLRPDPRDIAARLEAYYPGYRPERPPEGAASGVSVLALLRRFPLLVGLAANFGAYGNMSTAMVVTSLVLAHHGHSLPAISFSLALHTAGMFGPSMPVGWLADRLGRRTVMLLGVGLSTAGGLLVGFGPEYWSITLGTTLVGVGWCAANVASTATIADTTAAWERGRAVGVNDTAAALGSSLVPLVVGPLIEAFGLGASGLLAAALVLGPAGLVLALREPRPGRYAQFGTATDAAR